MTRFESIRLELLDFLARSNPEPGPTIDPTRDLRGQGVVDSLSIVDLVMHIERTFHCRVPATALAGDLPLSVDRLAGLLENTPTAANGVAGREITVGHMGSCVLAETLRIEGTAGGYEGFLSRLRRVDPTRRLRVSAHPRVPWDRVGHGAACEESFRRRFSDVDVVLADLTHESYLWAPLDIDDETPPPFDAPLVDDPDPQRRRRSNQRGLRPPMTLEQLATALNRALSVWKKATAAPVVLVGGLWHRPATLHTTAYTGTAFDRSMRRYLSSTGLTSPDAFFARLRGIDRVARRVAERRGVTFLDTHAEWVSSGEAVFADPIHLNDLGWSLLADRLLQSMGELGVVGRAAASRAAPARSTYRSVGARTRLAIDSICGRGERTDVVHDVFSHEGSILFPTEALANQFQATWEHIQSTHPERVILWGLGALGDRLGHACTTAGIAVVTHDRPLLAEPSGECRGETFVVAAVHSLLSGSAWVRWQTRSIATTIIELIDVPSSFAPGAEGSMAFRNSLMHTTELVLRIVETVDRTTPVVVVGAGVDLPIAWRSIDARAPRWVETRVDPATFAPGSVVVVVDESWRTDRDDLVVIDPAVDFWPMIRPRLEASS